MRRAHAKEEASERKCLKSSPNPVFSQRFEVMPMASKPDRSQEFTWK